LPVTGRFNRGLPVGSGRVTNISTCSISAKLEHICNKAYCNRESNSIECRPAANVCSVSQYMPNQTQAVSFNNASIYRRLCFEFNDYRPIMANSETLTPTHCFSMPSASIAKYTVSQKRSTFDLLIILTYPIRLRQFVAELLLLRK